MERVCSATVASSAFPTLTAASTAPSFRTGSAPGKPRQTGHVRVFGSASATSVEQPQKIFVSVSSWTWTSSPMTVASSRLRDACAVIVRDSMARG